MADIVDNEEVDRDTVEPEVLEQQFQKKYKLLTESAVTLKKSYINKLHATKWVYHFTICIPIRNSHSTTIQN